jgi:hypothetical protein
MSLLMFSSLAYAQGGATSALAGTVVDTSGGVVPGADIVVKNVATGAVFTTVSGSDGAFLIPVMPPGTYTATISLQGFKTAELKGIVLNVAVTSSVKATLEVGQMEETVVVTAATEIVQTQATSVASTMTALQISNLPVAGRAAFDLVRFMPGVSTTTGSVRDGSINGLPHATINITLDGMNIQDNYAKTWDGMFTRVSPRLDAVEEVTISTAAQGADMSGQGAVQVRFVTRSGTNRYLGSVYYYFRRDWMNTNTWFNLHRSVDAAGKPGAKPVVVQYQPGGRYGGPILKDKLFFFVNYEWVRTPGTVGNTRTIMSQLSEQGIFQWKGNQKDLLALAASKGFESTIDPTVKQLLADVRASVTCGTCRLNDVAGDPLIQELFWQQPTYNKTKYPTLRLDYNLTSNHRVSASITQNHLLSDPDTTNSRQRVFPGFPVHGLQDSYRWVSNISVRSVLTKNMVNEARIGGTGGATQFSPDTVPAMYSSAGVGDMKGYGISWSNFKGISNTGLGTGYSAREGSTRLIEDTLSWLKGKHSLAMGGSFTRGDVWLYNKQNAPDITFGMATGDPSDTMFTTANFPGASAAELGYARNLYSVLTGRITSIGRTARIGDDGKTYRILGDSNQLGRIWQIGFFVQDAWRVKPNLTVNGGLRWEIQTPYRSLNSSYSTATIDDIFGITGPGSDFIPGSNVTHIGNLYKPGVFQGKTPTYQMLEKGVNAYNTDWNNVAPSIGVAWTTGADSGFWHRVLGSRGDSVLRGGYNIAYQRGGMNDFTEVYGGNPGITYDATRNQTNGNLGTLPVLFRSSDLGPPSIALERVYPMAIPSASSNINIFDPNIQLPWAESGSIGWQRAVAKNMAIELRYIYSKSHDRWTLGDIGRRNYNEINIVENNFLNEFRVAQANLAANVAAGKGSTFAYTGAAGTSPLPILLANFNGSNDVKNSAKYTGTNWTNSTYVGYLSAYNPNPQSLASGIRGTSAFKANMALAGLPANFWVVNPDVNNAYIATNGSEQRYNGLQVLFTRRMSQGLQLGANYTFGKGYQWDFYSLRVPYVKRVQTYTNSSAASGNINHNLAITWVYELPFGQGRRLASNAGPFLHRLIGDWNIIGGATFATGRLVDFGNVRLVGFTTEELQKMYKLRMTTDPTNQFRTLVWILPQDIIDQTIKAFSVSATGYTAGEPTGRYFAPANSPSCLETVSGYGDCGARSVVVQGPPVMRLDLTISKRIRLAGRVGAEFQVMIFNVTNRVNFNPVTWATGTGFGPSVLDSYQVTGAVDQSRTMQLAFRINW